MNRLACAVAAIGLLLSQSGRSVEPELHLQRIGIEDGLSQASAHAVWRDRRGFLWIGTQDGLNRYDGHTIKVFRNVADDPHSLSGNFIAELAEDAHGDLWIATYTEGLNRYQPDTGLFTRFQHSPEQPDGLCDDALRALQAGADGRLWVGTLDGIAEFEPRSGRLRCLRQGAAEHRRGYDKVLALFLDGDGLLWIGSEAGLARYDPTRQSFAGFGFGAPEHTLDRRNGVSAITGDGGGGLWIGTETGRIAHVSADGEHFRYLALTGAPIRALHLDTEGRLWIASEGGGLGLYRIAERRMQWLRHDPGQAAALGSDTVLALHRDRQGLLWIGTWDGVHQHDPRSAAFTHYRHRVDDPDSLAHDWVRAFLEDDHGRLWVGTEGGLDLWDPEQRRFHHFGQDPSRPRSSAQRTIRAMAPATSGLWVGSDAGLDRFDPASGEFDPVDLGAAEGQAADRIFRIVVDGDQALWLATWGSGVIRLDLRSRQVRRYRHDPARADSLGADEVTAAFLDRQGRLWFGSNGGGLDRYDPASDGFIHHRHRVGDPGSLANDSIRGIYEDRQGRLWLATYGGGLSRFEPASGRFTAYTTRDGLANDALYGIVEDAAGRLWMSSNLGLSEFDIGSGRFRNFSLRDGLQSNEFNSGAYYRLRSGELLFGGIRGFNRFDPARLAADTATPNVVLTDFRLFNRPAPIAPQPSGFTLPQPIDVLDRLVLSHREDLVSFEFAALDFADPARNRYAYRLEGFDTDWIETDASNRRATYTRLPAGRYTLRVKAANAAGVWNEDGLRLALIVQPPPWRSPWAYAAYAVALAGAGYAAWRLHRRRRQERQLVEALRRDREQEQLLVREKLATASQITGGLAHEINNPLNFATLASQNLAEQLRRFAVFLRELAGPDADTEVLAAFDRQFVQLHEQVENIGEASTRIAGIVRDLRTISRLDPPEPQTVALGEMLQATVRLAGARYRQRVEFILDLRADPAIVCFPARLGQVFMNLTVNACQAIEARAAVAGSDYRGRLRVASVQREGRLEFHFEDNGEGIPEAVRARIFEPYFTTKPEGVGTGLGLAVSLGIVREHGGEIRVESQPGVGSRFVVELPLAGVPA